MNNLPKVVTQQRRGRASNLRLLDRKSDALPLSHRTWIPGSCVAYLGPDPGPVKPAICPVTAISFIKALTARVATYRLNCWLAVAAAESTERPVC